MCIGLEIESSESLHLAQIKMAIAFQAGDSENPRVTVPG